MKVGVICEGHTDRAVITNILKGVKGIDSSNIIPLRPEDSLDETDLANIPVDQFSNWTLVKKECETRQKLNRFLSLEGQDVVVIHIDSAESDEYGVAKPIKDNNYSTNLRAAIISKMKEWLGDDFSDDEIIYAVAVEETEAWVLTIYEKRESSTSADPKRKLRQFLSQKGIKYGQNYNDFLWISDALSKKKKYAKERFLSYNESLKEFCIEVENKL
ncbi:MAG: hypothetical protein CO098_04200 [Bacteroidetes bacterium CG_4_9_14_3_um_filter_41_19]|nr:MAG: hypothetical protein CO098_04200 [Bacteroidetes bacterium CG_4_9_14_3_um_filter_41_19]